MTEEDEGEVRNLTFEEVEGVGVGVEEVEKPRSAADQKEGEEDLGCGRRDERTLTTAVMGTEGSVPVVAVEGHLCLLEEAGVACLHVAEVVEWSGSLGGAGSGEEAGGRSGPWQAGGLEMIPARVVEDLVWQMEVVEAQQL